MRRHGVADEPGASGAHVGEMIQPDGHVLRVEELLEGFLVAVDDGSGVAGVEEFPVAEGGVAEGFLGDLVDFLKR